MTISVRGQLNVIFNQILYNSIPITSLQLVFILQIDTLGLPFLNLNCSHIHQFDEDLYRQLICYPQEVIPTMDMAVNELFFEKNPDTVLSHQIQVRPFNADKTRNMRALNPEGN